MFCRKLIEGVRATQFSEDSHEICLFARESADTFCCAVLTMDGFAINF